MRYLAATILTALTLTLGIAFAVERETGAVTVLERGPVHEAFAPSAAG